MNIEPLYVKVEEAARLLSISRSKGYELVAKGLIPALRIGASIRVPLAALRALTDQQANKVSVSEAR
jgi:excisionase family DNA binding protein